MSITLKTLHGKEIDSNMNPFDPAFPVRIGDVEISLKAFCGLAQHWLSGGVGGWPGKTTPAPVNSVLESLFRLYERTPRGTWQRKL